MQNNNLIKISITLSETQIKHIDTLIRTGLASSRSNAIQQWANKSIIIHTPKEKGTDQ